MVARRHERTQARRMALQVLYSGEIVEKMPTEIVEQGAVIDEERSFPDYARRLLEGIEAHVIAIDDCLADASENWALPRMPIVDRSLLRLATYEMLYVDEVPLSVSINEAVELAKEFGGEDDSPRFVNGVLGRIAQRIESGQIQGVPASASKAAAASEAAKDAASSEEGGGGSDRFASGCKAVSTHG